MSNPLTLDTDLSVVELQTDDGFAGIATLEVTLTDTRPYLPTKSVRYTIDWGDGTATEDSGRVDSPAGPTEFEHVFPPGDFVITVSGVNYAVPQPATVTVTHRISVRGERPPELLFDPVIVGPTLPLKEDWFFDLSQDNQLLLSSARLLLAVATGERLMEPTYGTRIREAIFAPLDAGTSEIIRTNLKQAFAQNETRLQVLDVQVLPDASQRSVTVNLNLLSLLDQRQVKLSTTFTQ